MINRLRVRVNLIVEIHLTLFVIHGDVVVRMFFISRVNLLYSRVIRSATDSMSLFIFVVFVLVGLTFFKTA